VNEREKVTVTGLWIRREGDELVALVEMPEPYVGDQWREVMRVAVDGEWEISHIVESSGLLRYLSEEPTDGQ